MSLRRMGAILKKQGKDTLKNKMVLIQFILFPFMAVVMSNAMELPGVGKNFFVILFATMYVGMAPLTSMASIISEEKETNTLRVLMMSNVKGVEYLLGVGFYILCICMLGAVVFAVQGGDEGMEMVKFLLVMFAGIITSEVIGAAIGTSSRNQMNATSVTIPVMMVCSFLPMIAMFNESVGKVSRFIYSQQVSDLLGQAGNMQLHTENIVVIGINATIAVIFFVIAYKRSGLAA